MRDVFVVLVLKFLGCLTRCEDAKSRYKVPTFPRDEC